MLRLVAIIVIAIMALCVGWHLVAAMLVVIAVVIAIFSTAFSHSSEERSRRNRTDTVVRKGGWQISLRLSGAGKKTFAARRDIDRSGMRGSSDC